MLFAEAHVQKAFRRQNVNGQSTVPQRDSEPEFRLPKEVNLVFLDGYFQDPLECDLCNELRIQQAHAVFFDGEPLHVASLQFHNNRGFFCPADGDTELRILKLSERFSERVDPYAKAPLLEPESKFVEVENPSMHRPAAPFG